MRSLQLTMIALCALTACIGEGEDKSETADTSTPTPTKPTGTTETGTTETANTGDTGSKPVFDFRVRYQFEDQGTSVTDSSGRDLHGTLSDEAARTTEGRNGSGIALLADGTRFVDLPSGIFESVDDFTIAMWVKHDTIEPWARLYDIGNGLADPDNRFMYLTANGINGVHAASYGGSPDNENVLIAGTQLPTNVWKHVAITGSGGARTLYIDGFPAVDIPAGPDVPPMEMEPIGGQSWLGKSRFPDAGLNGTLDDFVVYDRVLPQAEIADLAWPQQDYSHWRFDEGTGTTTVDSSDHAIATTLVDGPTWDANGRLGSAIDLAGGPSDQPGPHVSFATSPLANCTDELTVASWIKLRSTAPFARVFDFGTSDTAFIYLAPTNFDGNMQFAMVSPSGIVDVVTPGAVLSGDSAWHHVAVTVAADDSITLYVDGISVQTGTTPNVSPSDFAAVTENYLGKSRFPDAYLDGAIDDFRVSCRAYTPDEITNLSRP